MIKLLIDTISQSLSGIFDFVMDGINGMTEKNELLSARFGNERELLSSSNDGLAVSSGKYITAQKSREHLLYFGPTGSGKTTICLTSSAINVSLSKQGKDASLIINDPSFENYERLHKFHRSQGYTVYRFNPNDIAHSIYYNPLHRIQTPSDISKVATMLVVKGSKQSQDYWQLKSIELISLIIDFLLTHTSKVYQNIANVYMLLEELAGDEDTVSKLFADKATEMQWRKFKGVLANSENAKAGIISSAISHLSFVGNDKNLCNVTSVDTFDFSRLAHEKIVLYLNVGTAEIEYYRPLLGLFFEQLFTELFRSIPKETDNYLYLLIDEMSSIPLPSLSKVIANARKYFSILGIFQSESQIFENYNQHEAKSILNNACRAYMSGLNQECESISKSLGEYEYYTDKDKKMIRKRPLMTPNEVRTMPNNRVIVMPTGGMLPIYCKVKPYYKHRRCKKYLNATAEQETEQMEYLYEAQYLSLDQYRNDDDKNAEETS